MRHVDFLQLGVGARWALAFRKSSVCAPKRRSLRSGGEEDINCIMIWMDGGPSHYETFDPKPEAPSEIRGHLRHGPTCVPGVRFSEPAPELAKGVR